MTDMQPRLIKGLHAEYTPAHYPGSNTSGFIVYGRNVLVRTDECSSVSSGGVMLPIDMVDQMTQGAETGCVFLCGPDAFSHYQDGTRWDGAKPAPGDRVYFEKYAGQLARGRDGHTYRIMDDRAVAAGLDPDWRNPEGDAQADAFARKPALAMKPAAQMAREASSIIKGAG